MPKIQLSSPPTTFPGTVEFKLLSGLMTEIKVEFVYRKRTEYAEFIKGLYPNLKGATEPIKFEELDVVERAKVGIDGDVRHILGAVKSWDLDDPVNEASARLLVDTYPQGAAALMHDYQVAITEGRAKNS